MVKRCVTDRSGQEARGDLTYPFPGISEADLQLPQNDLVTWPQV